MATQKTAVEHFVEAMVRTHGLKELPRMFVEKALVLIDRKLDDPCCTDDEATINLITRRKHIFPDTIESMLRLMPKHGNVRSLERARKVIERRLFCCAVEPLTFALFEPADDAYTATISIGRDANSLDTTGTADLAGGFDVIVSYRKGKRFVRLETFSDDGTAPIAIATIEEYIGGVWTDTTSEWTSTGVGVAEKEFSIYTLPNIRVTTE